MGLTPVILTIAGSDSSAGAGLQADLKTGYALGCYPLTAVTCVVNEVPGRVFGIHALPPDWVAAQVRECLRAFPVAAIKTGMLYSAATVQAVAAELPPDCPLVVDPIISATAGTPLMQRDTLRAYEQHLFPRATIVTPNYHEFLHFAPAATASTPGALLHAARHFAATRGCALLVKGGHLPGDTCADLLTLPGGEAHTWTHPRTPGLSTHGTGCTLSAALAAHLALGHTLTEATARAIAYTARAISSSHSFATSGTRALNHAAPAPLPPLEHRREP
ncbi:MAG: hydroxymethylpyrimidine/phosphomethylpyrimidine kinase [Akkermansiaceae bacterium]|nr:hydroxymethylpyrimidine/phosphomethylpyrimidine kinase [Akkermansiaceae bacterium]